MRTIQPVFRPPSEAESLILQVTIGCSHNTCTFCAMYRTKVFSVRPRAELAEEIARAGSLWPETPRVFLGDGDALAAPADLLLEVAELLRGTFPRLRRVSLYATPQNLLSKTPEELSALAGAGISLFYLGLESGSARVLKAQNKGVTPEEAVEAVLKGHRAGMRSSVMLLLGLGGVEGSREHATETARACNAMQPNHLSALTWMPVPEAPLFRMVERGAFEMPSDDGVVEELGVLIENLDLDDTVFRVNHASNPLPLAGRLRRDKKALLDAVGAARRGVLPLRPLFMRGT
jgi:radical SAM superfamily enzyme YgiQ (UPF0313 family)